MAAKSGFSNNYIIGCIPYLFAEASRRGKVAGGNRESITCHGGRAALGLGADLDASDELLDRYAAIFSQGLNSVSNQEAYRNRIEAVPKSRSALTVIASPHLPRHRLNRLLPEQFLAFGVLMAGN